MTDTSPQQTVALVTGSSRGIGKAIATGLRARGVKVIGHASRAYDDDTIGADIADPRAVDRLWDEALERGQGHIDILVNNAALYERNPIDSEDDVWLANWNRSMQGTLTAPAQLSRHALLHWQQRGSGGRMVHVASQSAYTGASATPLWHYGAAKAGLIALSKTIARCHGREGIFSYVVSPGVTETDMAASLLESPEGRAIVEALPLARMSRPEELASAVVFCALDAPETMTGAVVDVNGAGYVR